MRALEGMHGIFVDPNWLLTMRTVFPYGMPISIQCDASLDAGLDEKEAMLVRFLGLAGEPEVRLLDLAELHLPDSKDGNEIQ